MVWTAEDCALVLIDYQNEMFEVIRSETPADLVELHVAGYTVAGVDRNEQGPRELSHGIPRGWATRPIRPRPRA